VKSFSLPVLCIGIAASFILGFGLAWNLQTPADGLQTPLIQPTASVAPAEHRQSDLNQFADIWNKGGTNTAGNPAAVHTADSPPTMDEQKLHDLAMADPTVLHNLIQRFDSERNQAARDALKSVLSTIDKPEARVFFTKLATSSDPAQRREGFEMLKQTSPNSAEVRDILKRALASEQSPTALAEAVAAMKPVVVEPAESAAIISQLRSLTQHADPSVRSQSVLQLGQWDKNGSAQDSLVNALSDSAPQVRQAAIFAIAQSGARSENVKTSLMDLINSPNESREVKGSALQVLERFPLTKDEYASFTRARSQNGL
jgi:HEAT repeat protein